MRPTWELFDDQASSFERRAGLPDDDCREIAAAVARAGDARPGDFIVEIGPGTGQVGQWFEPPLRYLGMDYSAGMLREFQSRPCNTTRGRMLVRVDANADWPVLDGVARIVFSSRALHLLDAEHTVAEVFRVALPEGATLLIGRIEREEASVRSRMAEQMITRLRSNGFEGRRGEGRNRSLIDRCRRRGAQLLDPVTVARWKVSTCPRQSLDSWRCLKGLGGIPVPAPVRERILSEVEEWATSEFGGLDHQQESEESYVLKCLRIPESHRHRAS